MQAWQIVAIAVAAVLVVALIGVLAYNRNRRRHLREHFGSEYDRTVSEIGDQRRAESELARREARVRKLDIRPLTMSERQRFIAEWKRCQAQFVNDPALAVDQAERLVDEILNSRGYVSKDLDDRFADISAAYPDRTSEYREAREILVKHRQGDASTEELRRAFVRYRALFDEILGGPHEELKRAS